MFLPRAKFKWKTEFSDSFELNTSESVMKHSIETFTKVLY